ncbi:MAG: electron transfer flavoprotein subunit beta/FixA family protein [Candidatus Fermentibacteraceae bacterium]|nr:electron transfer flavoprotein subunit beta/FixA family protein [Candidatus Fermentibacteraceae bacterium]MBN2608990.1 electron transfer flavoprotein subunit beta/FixA family protein [Candidatus Fermentibacteraceae bacterium]
MRIVVAVKQVPDTSEVRIDEERGTLIREGVPSILNPFDEYALEEAMRWRDELGGSVTVVTMGPPQAEAVLREAVSMGADDALLLSDRAFAGADTWATSHTLARAVVKMGDVDVVMTGKQAIDGDTAQTGPGIAASLDWPQITFVGRVRELTQDSITAERYVEGGCEVIRSSLPVVITVLKDANTPRLPSLRGKMKARKMEIPVWGMHDLGLSPDEVGLDGSPTRVVRIMTPETSACGEIHRGEPGELAKLIADYLLGKEGE